MNVCSCFTTASPHSQSGCGKAERFHANPFAPTTMASKAQPRSLLRPSVCVRGMKAENLLASDSGLAGSKSDPYCIVTYAGVAKKTKCKRNTLNPKWPKFLYVYDYVRATCDTRTHQLWQQNSTNTNVIWYFHDVMRWVHYCVTQMNGRTSTTMKLP